MGVKALCFCDTLTKDILVETLEIEPVHFQEMNEAKVFVISHNLHLSPTLTRGGVDANQSYNEEIEQSIRRILTWGKIFKTPVIAFGRAGGLVTLYNGGSIWFKANNHFGFSHPIFKAGETYKDWTQVPDLVVHSNHHHLIDIHPQISNHQKDGIVIHAGAFSCTHKTKFLTSKTNETRNLLSTREKTLYNVDPEVYSWHKRGHHSLCFEFFPEDNNIEFIIEMIVGNGPEVPW